MREPSLKRMDEIVAYYASIPGVYVVVAFGSNAHRERLDRYSDLDFLVLVDPSAKREIISQVSQLNRLCAIDALHVQYGDAIKLLFSDGVLCDFGVVTPDQLSTLPHGSGVYLWCQAGWRPVDISATEPARLPADELVTDALFHLYVGLLRTTRGEEAAAFYEVQVLAAQDVLPLLEGNRAVAFSPLRRAENLIGREVLREIMPGYEYTPLAVQAMLGHLSQAEAHPLYQDIERLSRSLPVRAES